MPNISVVVPVYKVEPYLHRCIDSILAQTYSDFQLILVDDGSPDNCGKICDEYAEKDSRIYVIHRENGGLSAARNSGIDWVFDGHYTEWITFIDSDDLVTLNYLEVLIDIAQNNDVNISVGNSKHAYEGDEIKTIINYGKVTVYSPERFWVTDSDLATVAWGKLYKTNLFGSIRYPEGKLHEDALTTYRLLFTQDCVTVSDAQIYIYYFSSSSIMRSDWSIKRLDALEAYAEQLLFFEQNGFKLAFMESKKNFVFSIQNNISEIKKSDDKKSNFRVLINIIKSYLYRRYNSKILSSDLCCRLYIKKLIMEQFVSIRVNVLKNAFEEEGARGVKKKLLREQDD